MSMLAKLRHAPSPSERICEHPANFEAVRDILRIKKLKKLFIPRRMICEKNNLTTHLERQQRVLTQHRPRALRRFL